MLLGCRVDRESSSGKKSATGNRVKKLGLNFEHPRQWVLVGFFLATRGFKQLRPTFHLSYFFERHSLSISMALVIISQWLDLLTFFCFFNYFLSWLELNSVSFALSDLLFRQNAIS